MVEVKKDSGTKTNDSDVIRIPGKHVPDDFIERHKGGFDNTVDTLPPPEPLPPRPDQDNEK